ncbi:cold-shock protein [Bacteroidota bacterium]
MEKGKVKWYDAVKGFGFIEPESGKDLFVHRTGLSCNANEMQENALVEYEVKDGEKGLYAENVKVVG